MNRWGIRLLLGLFLTHVLHAQTHTRSGNLNFNLNHDGTREMVLNSTGLGIGVANPSCNLQVAGNSAITGNVYLETTTGNSILNVVGSLGLLPQSVSSNATLGGNTLVHADTTYGDIHLGLPAASAATGRMYWIKNLSSNNHLSVWSANTIDGMSGNVALGSNTAGFYPQIKVVSDGTQWLMLSASDNVIGKGVTAEANLVAYWKLDETSGSTAYNQVSGGVNGALQNHTFATSGAAPSPFYYYSGGSLDQDATDDYISFASTSSIVTQNFTVTCWIKLDTVAATTGILGKYNQPYGSFDSNIDWHLGVGAGSTFQFVMTNNNGSASTTSTDAAAITVGTWYHMSITFNGGTIAIYRNGVLKDSDAFANTAGTEYDFIINDSGGDRDFDGQIDEVRIYNYAMPQATIEAVYKE